MKKFIFVLCALLLLPLFAACNNTEPVQTSSEASLPAESSDVSAEESVDSTPAFPLEEKRFDTELTILCVAKSRHTYGELQFVPSEEQKGNVINDAVTERNNLIEERYGIKLKVIADTNPYDLLYVSAGSGLDTYQLVANSVNNMLPYATENYFWSLNDDLHLEGDWWDQNAIETLSVTDSTFFVAGDCLLADDDYCYCILYNKDIYENNSACFETYGDIYELVRDKNWTYDALYQMAKQVSLPDSNGQWSNVNCTYGFLGEGYGTGMLVGGSGVTTAVKDSKGGFRLTVTEDKSVSAFSKVFDLMTDKTATLRVEQIPESWGGIFNMFISGKALFNLCTVSTISGIKTNTAEEKVNYGVLPIPKYDATQENYYNSINVYQSEVLAVPATNKENYEATMYALEALGYWSKYTPGESVTHAYYETTLKLQAVNSTDDEEMLDLIVNNRLYDVGAIYNWGESLLGIWSQVMRSGANTLTSSFDKIKDGAEKAMEKTVEDYAKIAS